MSDQIDLNADVGEIEGLAGRRSDAEILKFVSSCNIACGGHAGNAQIMMETVAAAQSNGVQIGAHPSYPDRENFGRRAMDIADDALVDSLLAQVRALIDIAGAYGADISHLKPHGALYNRAAKDPNLAAVVVRVASELEVGAVVGPPSSQLQLASKSAGLSFISEGFADRAYEVDGSLVDRVRPGALINDPMEQGRRAVQMVKDQTVTALNGDVLPLPVRTICLHGDGPNAAESACAISRALRDSGVRIAVQYSVS